MRVSRRPTQALLILAILAATSACGGRPAPGPLAADLLLHNARIVTMEETAPDAEAIAIRSDRIVGVGPTW